MMKYRYSFHNLLNLCLDLPETGLIKDLDLPFRYYETSDEGEACDLKMVVEETPFPKKPGPLLTVDHQFYLAPGYFYCNDVGGGGRWQVSIDWQSSFVEARFHGTAGGKEKYLYPHLLPQDLILLPLMEILLARKNVLLLHAAAVGKNDRCFLLVGRGSAGKTTLVMNFLRRGYQLLGDERVLVDTKGQVWSFLLHNLTLQYKLDHLKGEQFCENGRTTLGAVAKYLDYLWQGYRDSNKIMLNTLKKAKLQAVFFLNPQLGNDVVISPESTDQAKKRLLINNRAEWQKGHTFSLNNHGHYFSRYADIFSFIFPQSEIATHWQVMEEKIAQLAANQVPFLNLIYPVHGADKTIELILEALDNLKSR